jgi:hypothetical protein
MYIVSFLKIGSGIQKLFFQNKRSRLIKFTNHTVILLFLLVAVASSSVVRTADKVRKVASTFLIPT